MWSVVAVALWAAVAATDEGADAPVVAAEGTTVAGGGFEVAAESVGAAGAPGLEPQAQLRGGSGILGRFRDQQIQTQSSLNAGRRGWKMCLAVQADSLRSGADLEVALCERRADIHRWSWDLLSRILWTAGVNKCVGVEGNSNMVGARVEIADCDGLNNQFQKWIIDNEYGRIRWGANTRMCMALTGDSERAGTPVRLAECDMANPYQNWCISTLSQCSA